MEEFYISSRIRTTPSLIGSPVYLLCCCCTHLSLSFCRHSSLLCATPFSFLHVCAALQMSFTLKSLSAKMFSINSLGRSEILSANEVFSDILSFWWKTFSCLKDMCFLLTSVNVPEYQITKIPEKWRMPKGVDKTATFNIVYEWSPLNLFSLLLPALSSLYFIWD